MLCHCRSSTWLWSRSRPARCPTCGATPSHHPRSRWGRRGTPWPWCLALRPASAPAAAPPLPASDPNLHLAALPPAGSGRLLPRHEARRLQLHGRPARRAAAARRVLVRPVRRPGGHRHPRRPLQHPAPGAPATPSRAPAHSRPPPSCTPLGQGAQLALGRTLAWRGSFDKAQVPRGSARRGASPASPASLSTGRQGHERHRHGAQAEAGALRVD